MTTSSYIKMLNQIQIKPAKMKKYNKYNVPKERKYGASTKKCIRCGRTAGHVSKYGINLCRQCFREVAKDIGFKKFS
jgi:small subunit ribosomal protein S14